MARRSKFRLQQLAYASACVLLAACAADIRTEGYESLGSDPLVAGPERGWFLSASEIAALPSPTSTIVSEANGTATPTLADQDSRANTQVLAAALVFAKQGGTSYLDRVCRSLSQIQGTERGSGSRGLSVGRELGAYVIAAELVNARANCPSQEPGFRTWLSAVRRTTLPDGRTIISTHEDRPNNWGTMAGFSRIAADLYLGDTTDLNRAAAVLHGYLGDRSAYAGFSYGDLSWQCNPSAPVGVNPACTKNGVNIDGAPPDDARRCGGLSSPPCFSNYIREGHQGSMGQIYLLARNGFDAANWNNQAGRRIMDFVYRTTFSDGRHVYDGDDSWMPFLVNRCYGTSYSSSGDSWGKNLGGAGWWARAARCGGSTPPPPPPTDAGSAPPPSDGGSPPPPPTDSGSPPPPADAGSGATSVVANADSFTDASAPTTTHGGDTVLWIDGDPERRLYVRFTNPGTSAGGAALRIYSTVASGQPIEVRTACTTATWSESTLSASSQPCAGALSAVLVSFTPVLGWNQITLPSSAVPAPGATVTYVLRKAASNTTRIDVQSREAANKPTLVFTP